MGISKVHHFVKELVDDNKVVANTFFADFSEITAEYFDESVEEKNGDGTIDVAVGYTEDYKNNNKIKFMLFYICWKNWKNICKAKIFLLKIIIV